MILIENGKKLMNEESKNNKNNNGEDVNTIKLEIIRKK